MSRRRTHLHAVALWLTLAGVLLRGLIPVGFMPGWVAASEPASRSWVVICPTSPLRAVQHTATDPTPAGHLRAALAALPEGALSGPICHGAGQPAAVASVTATTPDDDHGSHRIAAEHLDCPFAAAVAAVLPAADVAPALPARSGLTATPSRTLAHDHDPQRRRPPARAPPAGADTTLA